MKKIILFLFLIFPASVSAGEIVSISSLKELRNAAAQESLTGNLLVYFWASWCPDCREKLGGPLAKLQAELPKATIITVNSDRDEGKGVAFVESEKVTLPVYRDSEKALSKALKLFAIPAWAVLKINEENQWQILMSSTGSDLEMMKQQLLR
jgi:thiol-disulfide isomerase/thioredoxin